MKALRQLTFILVGLLAVAGPAQALLTIKITQGLESALPIAVVPFGTIDNAPQGPLDIGKIIAADLARSGRFKPMDPKDMPARPHDFSSIDFKDWRVLGMPNLVVGKVTPTGSGSYDISFRLVDVYKAAQIVGYKVQAQRTDLRLKAHQIADIVYQKLTGERGAFATRIAYVTVKKKPDGKTSYALQIADSDGYNAQTLLESPEPLMSPAWSPDGKKIAYVSFEGHNSAIYVQNLATGKRKVVASGPGINSSPAFSPDGKYLAMALSRDGNTEIYVLHLDSNRLQRLTYNQAIDTEPTWSPDGTKIAFTSDRGGSPQIYEMNLLGGQPKRLTFKGNYNASACFSPNGKELALLHGDSSGYHIAVQNLSTGQLTVLTKGSLDESPSFAPNGDMILYTTTGPHGTELAAVSVDGRVKQTLALKGGEVQEPAWGPFRQQ